MPLDPWIEYMEDQILKTEEKIKTMKIVVHTLEVDLVAWKQELDKYQGICENDKRDRDDWMSYES